MNRDIADLRAAAIAKLIQTLGTQKISRCLVAYGKRTLGVKSYMSDRDNDADIPFSGEAVGRDEGEDVLREINAERGADHIALKTKGTAGIYNAVPVGVVAQKDELKVTQVLSLELGKIDPGVGEGEVELARAKGRGALREQGTKALGGLDRDSALDVEEKAAD